MGLLILGVLRFSHAYHNHPILRGQASETILKLANWIFLNIVSVSVCLVVFCSILTQCIVLQIIPVQVHGILTEVLCYWRFVKQLLAIADLVLPLHFALQNHH